MRADLAKPLPPEWGHYFAGLSAGEACFAISWADREHRSCRCVFIIRMREDEEPLLRQLQEVIGVGSLRRHRARGATRPIVQWRASAVPELLRLVEIFDRYPLRSKKARDYEIWREAVLLLAGPKRSGRAERLRELKEMLHEVRAYRPRDERSDDGTSHEGGEPAADAHASQPLPA